MPFSVEELTNITNSALDVYLGKGEVYKQNVQNKPLIRALDAGAKTFAGGRGQVSLAVKSGQGGLTLSGYEHDDVLQYGNPANTKRINFTWREHFIGMGLTHSELKRDGITVVEPGANASTAEKSGREEFALANILEEKMDEMNEDYASGWNALLWGDGSSDAKAIAGVRSFILDNPALGSTGGLNRTTNTWWRNRAATAAALAASTGPGAITSTASGGGALLQFLQREERQLDRFSSGRRPLMLAGSDFIGALEAELRGNGQYAQYGWSGAGQNGTVDGKMPKVTWGGMEVMYDPTLDNLGLAKRMYSIDTKGLMLLYMEGEKMKKSSPARPHNRMVYYVGLTTTAVMVCKRLNTSAVYDIA